MGGRSLRRARRLEGFSAPSIASPSTGIGRPSSRRPIGQPSPERLDHYKVFEVKYHERPVDRQIRLSDAFYRGLDVTVGLARYFAVPTTKEHRGRSYEIENEATHYVIYDVRAPGVEFIPKITRTRDQFGRRRSIYERLSLLAVPCLKREWKQG